MNLLAQTALLVALTSLGMGVSVLSRQWENKLFLSFSAACGAIFAWSLCFFLEKVFGGGVFYELHLMSGVWLGPAALLFLRVWVDRFPQRWMRAWSQVLWVSSISLAMGMTLLWLASGRQLGAEASFWRDLMYFSPGFVVIQLVLILVTRRTRSIRDGVVFGGALLVLAFSTMDHVPALGSVIPAAGNLLLCAYLILLGQAVRQQKLLDLRALSTRFVMLLVLALMLTLVYLVLVAWVHDNSVLFFLNSFAVSFLLVMMLEPLHEWTTLLTDRLLASRDAEWKGILEKTLLELQGARDLESWERAFLGVLERLFGASDSKLVLLYRDVSLSRGLLMDEVDARRRHHKGVILVDTLLAAEASRVASRSTRERSLAVVQELKSLGYRALFPLMGDTVLGWALVRFDGTEPPPQSYFRSWGQLRQLEGFLRDAARSLSMLIRVRDEAERERLAALGEMAAGLAHEIRNPLGAIQGAVQLLPQSQDSGPWTQVIREEVAKMNHVVAQFLAYSRRPSYQKVSLEVSSWLTHAVERLNQGLLRSGLSDHAAVQLEVLSTDLKIELEPDAFFQVFENLIRNSVQARATRISLRAVEIENRRKLLLDYRDNGMGISEQAFSKLFSPFFTTRTAGTGLGLSICRRIVEGHGGTIEALRTSEAGAAFTMILPLSQSQKGTQAS